MQAYKGLMPLYGDLHNHCGISYGYGTIEEAFKNAREQLDFCSVTGHALWPDMPEPNADIQHLIDFHERGFARLRELWDHVQYVTEKENEDGTFVTFLSFEMHSRADGDYTILYGGASGDILEVGGLRELFERMQALRDKGIKIMAFPHHIAYRRGSRGVNWATFNGSFSPVVEILSMHGCGEADETPRPFLHTMGPADHKSTMQYGLSQGCFFGVVASTDHHSGHPGSYGHGRTAVWAQEKTRQAIWQALQSRMCYALTGDRIRLELAINGHPMGSRFVCSGTRNIDIALEAGAPIDCVDIIKNNKLIKRFSEYDVSRDKKKVTGKNIRTKLHLDVGWGAKKKQFDWNVLYGISKGKIVSVEPRFRGAEVVCPLDKDGPDIYYCSHWEKTGCRAVAFRTTTFGNPNNVTNATQGMCLEIDAPSDTKVWAEFNGKRSTVPLTELLEGAYANNIGDLESPAFRFHRAPLAWEYIWNLRYQDNETNCSGDDVYYIRVRQKNEQYAWSSPILVKR